jgi:hypothetical protein
MSMHLEGPWLSTTGKRKGKQKFRNADEARKARELEESWKELQKKWGLEAEQKRKNRALTAEVWKPQKPLYRGANDPRIPSLNNGLDMGPAVKAAPKVYTGTKIKGIGTMHKSNAVPIFTDDEAKDIANMRR